MAVATLNKDNPADKIVAIGNDAKNSSPSFWKKITEAKPEVDQIPSMGSVLSGDVTVENLLSYNPDLTLLPLDAKNSDKISGFTDKMDAAGLKYAYIDFRENPRANTKTSMEVLGKVFDREEKAKEFNEFYSKKEEQIAKAVSGQDKVPSIVWRAAGLQDCCSTVGDFNMGQQLVQAGGENLGEVALNGKQSGSITPEKFLSLDPKVVVATGGEWAKKPDQKYEVPNAELGYGTSEDTANKTRENLTNSPGFDQLNAGKEGRLYSVWYQFYTSPWNIFLIEQFAKWLHPEQLKGVNPAEDFEKFHEEWLPYSYSGTFFSG